MGTIDLKMLGAVDLIDGQGKRLGNILAQPKRLALFTYLLADPDRPFHSRDDLIGLFWPETGDARARAALSQALYFLRRELGEGVLVTRGRDEVGIEVERVRCDGHELRRARQIGDHRRVVQLYQGELLQGLYLVDTVPWEHWLGVERDRYRRWAAESALALAEQACSTGLADEVSRFGRLALELSDDDEIYLQRWLALLDAAGDRAGVAREFRSFEERLKLELDTEVAPETRALYGRIMARTEPVGDLSGDTPVTRPTAVPGSEGAIPAGTVTSRVNWIREIRLTGVAAMAFAVIALGWQWWQADRGSDRGSEAVADSMGAPGRVDTLIIVPFVDQGGIADSSNVGPALRLELAARLSALHRLRVLLPESETDANPSLEGINGTGYRLEGTLIAGDSGLQMHLELSRVADSEESWRRSKVIGIDDLRAVSARAAEWTAAFVVPSLSSEDVMQLREGVSTTPEAYTLYLRGRHQLTDGSAEAFQEARRLFEQSLALDPAFAPAWSGLADAYVGQSWTHSLPDVVAFPRAREAAERSLELNPALAEGHASLAEILNRYYWDSTDVERHFREAMRLRPGSADTHLRYAAYLRNMGRFEESRREAITALELDPLTIHTHVQLVILDLTERRFAEAVARARRLAEISSDVLMAQFLFARCLIANGELENAIAELDRLGPGAVRPPAITLRGYALGRLGRLNEARQVMLALESMMESTPDASVEYDMAVVHLGMGEAKQTLEYLDRAIDHRDIRVRLIAHEPMFESLRTEPGFPRLLHRAGLSFDGGELALNRADAPAL